MRAISKTAARVMDTLVGMMEGDAMKLDNAPGAFMPLHVEKIGTARMGEAPVTLYSVAHYGKQNGDAMRDPDVVLMRGVEGGDYYPVSFRNDYVGKYDEAVVFGPDGDVVGIRRRTQTSIASFMTTWCRNIKVQQLN